LNRSAREPLILLGLTAIALIGAVTAQITLGKVHDRQLAEMGTPASPS
jgi:hypothetical protein